VSKYLLSKPQLLFTKQLAPRFYSANPTPQELASFPVDLHAYREGGGVAGSTSEPLFVAPDGTFYRRYGNKFICQFDRSGRLVRAIRTWEEASSVGYEPQDFTVDRQGRVFLLNDGTLPVLVFDRQGRRLTALEQRIRRGVEQVSAQHQKRLGDGWWARCWILVDKAETLHLCHLRIHVKIDLRTGQVQTFDDHVVCRPREDGTCWTVTRLDLGNKISFKQYNSEGVLTGESEGNDDIRYRVVIYGRDGQPVRQYTIPREKTEVEKLLPVGGLLGMDGRGHVYLYCTPQVLIRSPLGGLPNLIGAVSYFAVCEYDEEGRSLGVRAVYADIGEMPMIDEAGNVYWTEYEVHGEKPEEQFMRLMMAPVPQSTR